MELLESSGTASLCQAVRSHVPEAGNIHIFHHDSLKSAMNLLALKQDRTKRRRGAEVSASQCDPRPGDETFRGFRLSFPDRK
jgi:hypothetical protein